ncbi:hypothetical protein QTO34_012011 [Cnephaeus nilssonii]|uniref:Fork-head domain-containing protein n=1 Tax=Cnephaeus nilssonii TaxID=3371016 RepID=A0AA40LEB9_CNENI|nr:hypothetical protein QTO34_012011 [Eptesicus nilssonii]
MGKLRPRGTGAVPGCSCPPCRLLATTGDEDLPGDLQSLSWLTAVDVPRLQQMASGRVGLGGPSAPHPTQFEDAWPRDTESAEQKPSQKQSSQRSWLEKRASRSISFIEQVVRVAHFTGSLAGVADLHVGATPGPLLHGPAGMAPPGVLGLGPLASHRAGMPQFPVGGQPPSSLQDPPQMYSLASQPQFPLPRGAQQCPPVGLYGSRMGHDLPTPSPAWLCIHLKSCTPNTTPSPSTPTDAFMPGLPTFASSCLIAMALKNSKTGSLPVSEIYSFMKEHFPYFKVRRRSQGWDGARRLEELGATQPVPEQVLREGGEQDERVLAQGLPVGLNLARIDKMEEEMHKWKRKDLAAIHRSMANPEELDKLISDRPESCRRPGKPGEPEAPVLTRATTVAMAHGCLAVSQLPPQPLMTLSLHPSPLPHPAVGRAPVDFINISTDMNPEVDALDPSIMDFALQGNLWEDMKDEGFSLDTLGAFGDSPLGCELGASGLTPVSGSGDQSFPDLQVTGLYTAYSASDSVAASAAASSSSQYLGAPGNKPIALL